MPLLRRALGLAGSAGATEAGGVVTVQPSAMPHDRVVPLTLRAIRLILDRDAALRALSGAEATGPGDKPAAWPSGALLPSSVVRALETALRGRLVGTASFHVVLTPEDAKALVAWCREVAQASRLREGVVLRVAADVIEATCASTS